MPGFPDPMTETGRFPTVREDDDLLRPFWWRCNLCQKGAHAYTQDEADRVVSEHLTSPEHTEQVRRAGRTPEQVAVEDAAELRAQVRRLEQALERRDRQIKELKELPHRLQARIERAQQKAQQAAGAVEGALRSLAGVECPCHDRGHDGRDCCDPDEWSCSEERGCQDGACGCWG